MRRYGQHPAIKRDAGLCRARRGSLGRAWPGVPSAGGGSDHVSPRSAGARAGYWFDGLFAGEEKLRQIQVAADPRSIRLVAEILRADPADPLDILRIEAAAQDIFLRGIALLNDAEEPSRRDRLMHLAEMLEADLGHDWTLAKMARLAGMSARNLTGRFGREFGTTPFDWLRQRRLLRARDMVVGEGVAISAAASELGFSSPAHFSTAFRAMFGEAPSRARRAAERASARNSAVR